MVDEKKTMPVSWAADKFYSNAVISEYNSILEKIAADQELPLIAMSDVLNEEDLEDGLHPGPDGHEKMLLRVRDFLVAYFCK